VEKTKEAGVLENIHVREYVVHQTLSNARFDHFSGSNGIENLTK